jgi:hypothetical protein
MPAPAERAPSAGSKPREGTASAHREPARRRQRREQGMNIFDILAEQRITDALLRGEFDDLPGAGRPLEFDDDPFVSPEQRMVHRILKNAGFAPREIVLRKEIAGLRQEIASLPPGEMRSALKRKLVWLIVQLGEMR